MLSSSSLWQYRDFIRSAIINDIRNRFTRSTLGSLWAILQPLAQAAIFAMVMAVILKARLPGMTSTSAYAVYLLSGLLGWNLFIDSLNQGVSLFLNNADTIKKVRFPLASLPTIAAGIALVNHILLLVATVFILTLLGYFPNPKAWLILPILGILTLGVGLSIGIVLGVINVFIRDVNVVVPIVTQLLFWFSPIVYVPTALPEFFQKLLLINPMAGLVQSYQAILVFDTLPAWEWLAYPFVLTILALLLGRWLLRRCFAQMVDIL